VEEFDFVEAFDQVILKDDEFGDTSDLQLVLSSNNYLIDGLFDTNALNVIRLIRGLTILADKSGLFCSQMTQMSV